MSIYLTHEDEKDKTGVTANCFERKLCFYCHKYVGHPRIMWMGATGDIWMHPECALQLCVRLIRDVHESGCDTAIYR